MPTAAPKTTERIIDASLALFNARGFANVPLSAIAMEVGISPGNLSYHFKSKADIVMAVFPQLQAALAESKRTGEDFIPKEGVRRLLEMFQTMWRYRFFFNGLLQLIADDRTMRKRYLELEGGMIESIQRILDELTVQGYIVPTAPWFSTHMWARSWWMMWLSWLRYEQLESPRSMRPRDSALYEAVVLTIGAGQPYFRKDIVEAMLTALEAELPGGGLPIPTGRVPTIRKRRRTTVER